jgi:ubiquinone biosynthesis protein UbiJ
MRATYRWELEDGRSFILRLVSGRLSLEEGAVEADCVFRCPMSDLSRALSGRINLLTAVMRGDIHLQGDLELAKRLYRYLRIGRMQEVHP